VRSVRVEVPATSANLGPGFDTLGLALDITNVVTAVPGGDDAVLEGGVVDPHRNLVCDGWHAWRAAHGVDLPGVTFRMEADIPFGKGLGSSAACILAGVTAAAACSGPWSAHDVLDVAARLESHPDNLAAAVMGGLTAAICDGAGVRALHLAREIPLDVALFLPDQALSTAAARHTLPREVPLRDAAFNLGRLGYLAAAVTAGKWEEMGIAMTDRLHQPYRASLVPGLTEIMQAALDAGAYGASLSGAGPAVLALAPLTSGERIAAAMLRAAHAIPCRGETRVAAVRPFGLTVNTLEHAPER